jgi:hypothetical protein
VVSKRYAHLLFAGCAAVLAAVLGVTAALAATTWTVKPGGAITAKSGTATFKDNGSVAFTCKSLSLRGTLKNGSGLSGFHAGSISAVGFHTCTSGFGRIRAPRISLAWTLRATSLPWHVNFSSENRGVVTGTISHVEIKVLTDAPCSAVFDGTGATAKDGRLAFSYTGSTGRLTVLTTGGNLHAYNVVNCIDILNNGDPVTISATFTLNPKQTIISP